jgi:hypothetical protein
MISADRELYTVTRLTRPNLSAPDYDTIQPRLGLYDAVSVDMMDGRPYDWAWAQIFRRFDAETLFKLSLRSCSMFKIVMEYVKECTPATHHVDERK